MCTLRMTFVAILFVSLLAIPGVRAQGEKKDAAAAKPLRALFITGGCCHDYKNQKNILTEGISARTPVEWTIEHEGDKREHKHTIYSKPDWWKGYDLIVHDECFGFVDDDAFVDAIVNAHVDHHVPVVAMHCSVHSYRKAKTHAWSEMLGIRSEAHGKRNNIAITYTQKDDPITKGLENWTSKDDELYNNIKVYEKTTPLATGKQGADEAIVVWKNEFKGLRVFVTTIGHTNQTVGDPRYLDLVTRGMLWTVGRLQ